jgi:hypothetical protein
MAHAGPSPGVPTDPALCVALNGLATTLRIVLTSESTWRCRTSTRVMSEAAVALLMIAGCLAVYVWVIPPLPEPPAR